MLHNAIHLWPEEYWNTRKKFFYHAYHTLVFLDYYLSIPPRNFSSALPFTLVDPADIPHDAIDDVMPNRVYSKQELLEYSQFCREKCRKVITGLTEEKLAAPWIDDSHDLSLELSGRDALQYSVLDILLYNMKHVQHHVAQMNLLLRQTIGKAPDYVSHAEDCL